MTTQVLKDPNLIPAAMRARRQWVVWNYEFRKGKTTKPPLQLDGTYAKTNDPETWTDFDSARNAEGFQGIGYVFAEGDGLVGIDLDHCFLDDETMSPWAAKIVESFESTYIEKSPSGEGLHIICRGLAVKTGQKKWKDDRGIDVGIEIYDYRSPRYFTVTGDTFQESDAVECLAALETIHREYYEEPVKDTPAPKHQPETDYSGNLDTAKVLSALAVISPDLGYAEWIKVGQALQSGGLSCQTWDIWSSRSSKYEPGLCETKWKTFDPNKGNKVDLGTIFRMAKEHSGGSWTWKSPKKPRVQKMHAPPEAVPYIPTVEPQEAPPPGTVIQGGVQPETDNVIPIRPGSIFKAVKAAPGHRPEHRRWNTRTIPYEYRLSEHGLLKRDDQLESGGSPLAGPIIPIALTIGCDGADCGLILEFQTLLNDFKTIAVPRTRLYEDPKLLAKDLADVGFRITVGKEKDLCSYIEKCLPDTIRTSVTQTGWASTSDPDELVFVLPNSSTKDGYHYQPERYSAAASAVKTSGTLKDWLTHVYDDSPYPLFAFLAALSAPLLKFAGMDSGGFHFYGGSSSGKTTLLQLAASVIGNGADPSDSPSNPYTRRWNFTNNAAEAMAAASNDLPLVLDELGSFAGDASKIIYDLSGGQGKTAMDASRNLRKQRVWRTCIISSGEVSSQSKIEEGRYGRKSAAKAGQLIRLLDLEVHQGMFKSREQVDRFKRYSAMYYGTLGEAFIQELAKLSAPRLRAIVTLNLDKCLQQLINGRKLDALQERALKRFAIVEVAGLLVMHFKLIPGLSRSTLQHAIETVVDDWTPASAGLSDVERGINSLLDFMLKYQESRFKRIRSVSSSERPLNEIAGYYDAINDLYYVLPEAFRDAVNCEPRLVAAELRRRSLLVTYREDSFFHRITVDGRKIRAYCIKSAFLGETDTDFEKEESF